MRAKQALHPFGCQRQTGERGLDCRQRREWGFCTCSPPTFVCSVVPCGKTLSPRRYTPRRQSPFRQRAQICGWRSVTSDFSGTPFEEKGRRNYANTALLRSLFYLSNALPLRHRSGQLQDAPLYTPKTVESRAKANALPFLPFQRNVFEA